MKDYQKILAIESSCDETAVAVAVNNDDHIHLLSNIIASSLDIQSKYGGIIPEQAAREQLKAIIPVAKEALLQAQCSYNDIDAIAVTCGPGLIGSLLVGVETAKTLALVWNKPLIPINHLMGHFYANWISSPPTFQTPAFPAIGLLVSGGHTDLILLKDHGAYEYLGGTRDDAAGECFDKSARLLGLGYPGGPKVSKLAEQGNPKAFHLPRPLIGSSDLDFSFSGLKTAVVILIRSLEQSQNLDSVKADLAASIQQAIIDCIIKKTVKAVQIHNVEQIIVAGGVAANVALKKQLQEQVLKILPRVAIAVPSPSLCTDNAAMIASAAFFVGDPIDPLLLQANPNLSLRETIY